ncbi:Transcription factor vib-1 [Neonectria ditissima]|uniref:Transcription factor vib-1 n=1 Tax=Neonectria ditissima TaxID=78410 RepID=A0A0P7AD20_9HYPO|nr:Transcription factor vib-1 [Neonectria ditissima]
MADLRGHPTHSSMWSNYGGPVHMSSRVQDSIPPSTTPLPGRPGSNHDVDHQPYPYSRYPQDEQEAYERSTHPDLASHHSYPSLKRSFSETEPPAYQEIVQDLRDDGSKMTVNHDHKLLAFKRSQDKHTIVDQQGRIQQLELSAQLHGMFFLSEMPTSTADGNIRQPELTCYRRNLFQTSGSLITPRGQLSIITESGETVGVSNMEVTISAIESVDGNPVRLIVIPWKTPPPNSPETNQSPDQEPPPLPLIPFQDDGTDADGEFAVYPIGWRRLQFRIATANNGRRKELQQHFVLHLKVVGTLASGSKVVLTEATTAPIVVRGRSPRNFQARKEIPLLGSSAGSRGQALVETGLGVVAGALNAKQQEAKSRSVEGQLPRSSFTFSAPKLPGNQLGSIRSNSYPTWNSPSQVSMSQVPSSGAGSYPATTIGADSFPKLPLTGGPNFTAEPQELPLQTSMEPSVQLSLVTSDQTNPPIRPQYTYVHSTTAPPQLPIHSTPLGGHESALSIPRYVDNPRPSKSPRHSHPSIRTGSIASETSPEYRYGSYAPVNTSPSDVAQPGYHPESSGGPSAPARDYYPSSSTWTTAGEPNASVAYTNNDGRPYPFPQEQYKSNTGGTSPTKTDSSQSQAPSVYSGGPRGSFDAMNQYSWSGN